MEPKEYVLGALDAAQFAVAIALNYPRVLQVEEYADLTAAIDIIQNIYKRLSK